MDIRLRRHVLNSTVKNRFAGLADSDSDSDGNSSGDELNLQDADAISVTARSLGGEDLVGPLFMRREDAVAQLRRCLEIQRKHIPFIDIQIYQGTACLQDGSLLLGERDAECTVLFKDYSSQVSQAHKDETLWRAVQSGSAELVRSVIASSANPNWCDRRNYPAFTKGRTCLELAAEHGCPDIAHILIDSGARFCWALHYAAKGGHGEVAQALVEATADVNLRSSVTRSHDFTPVHFAAMGGHDLVLQILILARADVRVLDRDGAHDCRRTWAPLHYAAANNHTHIVQKLLATGVLSDLHLGWALEIAEARGHKKVVQILRESGVRCPVQPSPASFIFPGTGNG